MAAIIRLTDCYFIHFRDVSTFETVLIKKTEHFIKILVYRFFRRKDCCNKKKLVTKQPVNPLLTENIDVGLAQFSGVKISFFVPKRIHGRSVKAKP